MRWFVIVLMLFTVPVGAVEPNEVLDDPALEARAREISKELRCLVCRNENIDSSNAGIAKDLRLLVRERLVAGDTNTETLEFIVERYGEYVLLNPPFSRSNAILWLIGPVLLVFGGAVAAVFVRRRAKPVIPEQLSTAEKARLDELTKS